jgi:hypothetical protein
MKLERSRRFFRRLAVLLLLGGGGLALLTACERTPEPAPSLPPEPTPNQDAQIERDVRAHLAAQDRIIEQQLANRRAAADLRGIGIQIQEGLQREIDVRAAQNGSPNAEGQRDSLLLAQAQQPSPSPAPTLAPQPSPAAAESKPEPTAAPVTTATKPDPKFQNPPTEDMSDSMKHEPGRTKPSPSPEPTASSEGAQKNSEPDAKPVSQASPSPAALPDHP